MTRQDRHCDHPGEDGFSLVEMLAVLLLTGFVVGALATISGQYMRNWSRSAGALQRNEALALGLDRLAMDLRAATLASRASTRSEPGFIGDISTMAFLRTATEPEKHAGLEAIVITAPSGGGLVRRRGDAVPLATLGAQALRERVELLDTAHTVQFAYLSADDKWSNVWTAPSLPVAVRISLLAVGNAAQRTTVVRLASDTPALCARATAYSACQALMSGQPIGLPQQDQGSATR